ncbi:hypothetical protein [Sphingobium fuliginis]|uniref:hypothetical protein n=1 Tax=Sphingobium fuliginis (strain ATCC 27551) TaxID=336203 RepID=UPI001ABFCAA6|nr:hypothetical protein [Sphingobium fuliginis]
MSKHFRQMLMGIGGPYYKVTNPRDRDGHWRYHLELIRPLAAEALASHYDWDIDSA